jgi:hypothetical protein
MAVLFAPSSVSSNARPEALPAVELGVRDLVAAYGALRGRRTALASADIERLAHAFPHLFPLPVDETRARLGCDAIRTLLCARGLEHLLKPYDDNGL